MPAQARETSRESIQWLVFQLVVDMRDVLVCQGIIAGANLKRVVHRYSPECGSTLSQYNVWGVRAFVYSPIIIIEIKLDVNHPVNLNIYI
jgi:hypothetical protein